MSLLQSKFPLIIVEKSGFYQLASKDGHGVDVLSPRNYFERSSKKIFLIRRQENRVLNLLKITKRKFRYSEFTTSDFAGLHQTSERSSVRHLSVAIEKGWVQKKGRARDVQERF